MKALLVRSHLGVFVLASVFACQLLVAEINTVGFDEPMLSAVQSLHTKALEESKSDDTGAASSAWGELGMLMQAHNVHEQAIFAYSEALNKALDPRWLYLRGISHGELGQVKAALDDFRVSLQYEPNEAVIWYRLGRELLRNGDADQAANALTQSIALNESLAVAHMAKGDALLLQKQLAQAKQSFVRANELAPSSGQVMYRLAQVERELGNGEVARTWLEKRTNQHAPEIEDPMLLMVAQYSVNPVFYISAARRAWERGDVEMALAAYRQAVSLDPNSLEHRLGLVRLLVSMKRLNDADEYLQSIIQIGKDSQDYWYLRTLVALQRNKLKTAQRHVEAASKFPENEEVNAIAEEVGRLLKLERASGN